MRTLLCAALILGLLQSCTRDEPAPPPPGNSYIERLERRVEPWRGELAAMSESAARAADAVISRGRGLYIVGPQSSFAREACGRAGGLMLMQYYRPTTALEAGDVVLAACTGTEDTLGIADLNALLERARLAEARVILFGPSHLLNLPAQQLDGVQLLPRAPFVQDPAGPSPISIESVSNVIGMWAWTAQFVARCVEIGKMPAIYQNHAMPGGRDRTNRLKAAGPFHTDVTVRPEAVANLGARYLDHVQRSLRQLHDENQASFARAADLLTQVHEAGGRIDVAANAHLFPLEMQQPQNPSWLKPLGEPADASPSQALIVLEHMAITWPPPPAAPQATDVWVVSSALAPPREFNHPRRVYIQPFYPSADAVVTIDGYDVQILPTSGIMAAAVYWRIVESVISNHESGGELTRDIRSH